MDPLSPEKIKMMSGILAEIVKSKDVDLARKCIHKGADPNEAYESVLPIFLTREIAMMNMLLEEGTNPNLQNASGKTILSVVVEAEYVDLAKALVKGGADPNIPNTDGRTALRIAVEAGSTDLVKILVEAGADPFLTGNQDKMSALEYARAYYSSDKSPEIVSLLLDGMEDRKKTSKTFNVAATVSDGTSSDITVSRLTPHKKPSTDPLKP